MKGALSVAASAYKALFTLQGPTQVSDLCPTIYFLFVRKVKKLIQRCTPAAAGGHIHPGHHDGRAGGDGLWGPAAEPAPADETQLQPAGCGERACSDDRQ